MRLADEKQWQFWVISSVETLARDSQGKVMCYPGSTRLVVNKPYLYLSPKKIPYQVLQKKQKNLEDYTDSSAYLTRRLDIKETSKTKEIKEIHNDHFRLISGAAKSVPLYGDTDFLARFSTSDGDSIVGICQARNMDKHSQEDTFTASSIEIPNFKPTAHYERTVTQTLTTTFAKMQQEAERKILEINNDPNPPAPNTDVSSCAIVMVRIGNKVIVANAGISVVLAVEHQKGAQGAKVKRLSNLHRSPKKGIM